MLQARNLFLSDLLLWCSSPACGKCQRSQHTCGAIARLDLGPVLSPTMIQLKLVRVLLDLVMTEGEFKRFGRLGPNHSGLAFPKRGASWYHGDHRSPLGFGAASSAGPGGRAVRRSPPKPAHGFRHGLSLK